MSMYYAGYEELGLILNDEDIDFFKKEYIATHLEEFDPDEDKEETMDDLIYCGECFTSGDGNGDFRITTVDGSPNGSCDGLLFYSWLTHEGEVRKTYKAKDCRGETLYIVAASIQCDPLQVFGKRFYNNPEELIDEMKRKVGKYLPENFSYAEKIGSLSYTCYA